MTDPLQFAYRTQKVSALFNAAPTYEHVPGFTRPEGTLRCFVYSPCGRYFAYASNQGVRVVDPSSGSVLTALPLVTVFELGFSPRGSFLSTWERPSKDEAGDAVKNLKVWRTVEELAEGADRMPLGMFVQKSQSGWDLQYTADERYCARQVTNEVHLFDCNDFTVIWDKLRVEGVADLAIAPGQQHNVAVFVPERKGQPAAVKVFNVPQFSTPISQKTFFKADKVQLNWNAQGTSLVVLAQTDVDQSNKSYYGETTMYLLSADGAFDARVTLDKAGPIHDVSWSPSSKSFAVIYGYMPAKTTLFNHRAVVMHSWPVCPRNTVIFSPTGRFMLVAGFGNLAGHIDVYDLDKDYAKICTIESGNPSVCAWSPDSRYILTATTSPRLRVDNGVKIWHVGGSLVYNEDMTELYSIMWRPVPPSSIPRGDALLMPVPPPHASAQAYLGTVKTPSKPAGAYRPPGARGTSTPLHFKREDEGGSPHVSNGPSYTTASNGFGRSRRTIPGAEFADAPSGDADDYAARVALKNKKKRSNKKARDANDESEPAGADGGGLGVPPPREGGSGSGYEGRSPERKGPHARAQSRSHAQDRNRSNTYRARSHSRLGQRRGTPAHADAARPLPPAGPGGNGQSGEEGHAATENQSAAAAAHQKRIRALQKKIRAIEDLEMRLAGGEKLEDTQVQKISSKKKVTEELLALEKEA